MQAAMQKWVAQIHATMNQLAVDFKKKPCYFLDMLFQGGIKLVVSLFTILCLFGPDSLHPAGTPLALIEITQQFKGKYKKLTDLEKEVLVKEYEQLNKKDCQKNAQCPNSHRHALDIANTLANVENMLESLSLRAGLDAMLVAVRNTHNNYMDPHWFFTNTAQ
ncbi:hypothetical protein Moror_2246 [Moniliophthora roreri MCA 2997]|uniref:Uncharacterized protein n=1 Tax=Moniliophthora roreri (strain MCA 2997) TaxID=1381753 RepID=V2XSA2_MONRO|nr:hypothetical protein Moror_2246 [Moniliophthora roreri MCA 2997]